MLTLNLSILLQAASVAIVATVTAFVYVTILTQPDQFLGWWKVFLHNTYIKITGWETDRYHNYKWVLKPIVDCELCVSGQMALWLMVFPSLMQIFLPIFSICLTILLTKWLAQAIR